MVRKIPYLDTAQPIGRVVNGQLFPEAWFVDGWNDLLNRTGGQRTNVIAASTQVAVQASATATALAAGAVATGYVLTPTNPVSITYGGTTATLSVAAHTRDEGGVVTSLPAGSVADPVPRGATYYVYYDTPYVGAPTYLATTNAADLVPASVKLVQTVAVPAAESVGSGDSGFSGGFFFTSEGLRI